MYVVRRRYVLVFFFVDVPVRLRTLARMLLIINNTKNHHHTGARARAGAGPRDASPARALQAAYHIVYITRARAHAHTANGQGERIPRTRTLDPSVRARALDARRYDARPARRARAVAGRKVPAER